MTIQAADFSIPDFQFQSGEVLPELRLHYTTLGYLVSDDGITWTEPQEEPILDTLDVPYAEVAALASSAYVEDDGTWVLYFYTWNTTSGSGQGTIGRATATNPLGPWTVDAEPVLEGRYSGYMG